MHDPKKDILEDYIPLPTQLNGGNPRGMRRPDRPGRVIHPPTRGEFSFPDIFIAKRVGLKEEWEVWDEAL